MLKTGSPYLDLGSDYLKERNRHAIARRMARKLESPDFRVTIEVAQLYFLVRCEHFRLAAARTDCLARLPENLRSLSL